MSGLSRLARRISVAVVLGALLAVPTATGASAAPRPLSVDVLIGGDTISGQVRANAYVEVVIRDASGNQLGRGLADSYAGDWEFWDFPGSIRPGYQVKVTAFNTQGTLEVLKLTVPDLTLAFDRSTDVASGSAPAGKKVTIFAYDPRWEYWGEGYDVSQTATANGAGQYAFDFSTVGIDVRGGASGRVSWSNAAHTVNVIRLADVPRIMLGIDDAYFWGITKRNVHVAASLFGGTSNLLAEGHAVGNLMGSFEGLFVDQNLDDYLVQGGEHLTAPAIAADVDWQVPAGISSVNVSSDKVSGKCFAHGRYQVYALDTDTWQEGWKFGNADANGAFTKDMTSLVNIRPSTYVEALCWTPEGDFVWDGVGTPPDSLSTKTAASGREH